MHRGDAGTPGDTLVGAADWLLGFFAQRRCRRLLVACSGGRDSTVLLHLLASLRDALPPLVVVHVDHGLHALSGAWRERCAALAVSLGLPFEGVELTDGPPPGASVEGWARAGRYRALATLLAAEDCVVTGHHQRDQVETVLQRALEGAGPRGLAGMPRVRRLGRGWLVRPLRDCPVSELERYAGDHALDAIDDPANADRRFLRSRLRHDVLPQIERMVPGAATGLARLGRINAATDHALAELTAPLLDGADAAHCPLARLRQASDAVRLAALRQWFVRASLPPPAAGLLQRLDRELIGARAAAAPVIRWRGLEFRRYRDTLYVLAGAPPAAPSEPLPWRPDRVLELPFGVLRSRRGLAPAVDPDRLSDGPVEVRFRGGGERCRPWPHAHSRTLKKLMQEWGVPPWQRALEPLVFHRDRLVAVGSRCIEAAYAVRPGACGLVFDWRPHY